MVDSSGSPITSPGVEGLLIYNGGTVHKSRDFNYTSAQAICKQMGYDRHERWRDGGFFLDTQKGYPVALVDVRCSSDDWSFCSYRTEHYEEYHYEDVFLTCGPGRIIRKIGIKAICQMANQFYVCGSWLFRGGGGGGG